MKNTNKQRAEVFYVVDHFMYGGKSVKWYYTVDGTWSDDKHRAKRFNDTTGTAMLSCINAYRDDENKAELVND